MNRPKLCDENCNNCPVVLHPNSRMLIHILNELYDHYKEDERFYKIVNSHCPNFTVCYDCKIDDFCHDEDCDIIHRNEE